MENKEAFDFLVAKMANDPIPSREDIQKAFSYLNDLEMQKLYTLIRDELKKSDQ